jgi:hypothetical protein
VGGGKRLIKEFIAALELHIIDQVDQEQGNRSTPVRAAMQVIFVGQVASNLALMHREWRRLNHKIARNGGCSRMYSEDENSLKIGALSLWSWKC